MAIAQITNKKFLDGAGTGYLWEKILDRYDSKLDNVVAADDSLVVANNNNVRVQISQAEGNQLELITTGQYKGLYAAAGSADRYEIVRDQTSQDYAATYRLKKYTGSSDVTGTDVGVINIPKDMVVSSGTVETYSTQGNWGNPGTYIHLVLANATNDDLYINAGNLIAAYTSGSEVSDTIAVTVDNTNHQITAEINDGAITMEMLSNAVQNAISAGGIQSITEGATNGTIDVDGTEVSVHGLGTAAYSAASAFDAAGAATGVLGTSNDTAATMTVYGVKQYASDVYDAMIALTNNEIDAAIAAATANV